ncbi:MAG: sodium:proton antiporter [Bacteroidales bacterium]|jgi:Na+/H+ antiporter NhaD/arsenite permease-like protein|nr:sodium:proton antiporter [Bacteroidales bacterium]
MGSTMFLLFIAGVIAIAFEDKIRVNKAAVAVGLSIILWTMLIETENVDQSVINSLGNVSTTLFFVLASMAIIEIVDSHGAFNVILSLIKTRNKRKLLWIFSFLTFTFSAVLGNLATVIIMVTLIRRMVIYKEDRLIFSSMIIIAANAGGSWSPIGDVTTLILWTGGNITVWSQVYHVILSALTMMIVPLFFVTFMFGKEDAVQYFEEDEDDYVLSHITPFFKKAILVVGLVSLAMVPILQVAFNIPPFMGVLLGLTLLWIMTDRLYYYRRSKGLQELRVSRVFSRIDISTVLFFLGILMSVEALKISGELTVMSSYLNNLIPKPEIISFVLGLCSSFLDNVALVAGTVGMYPLASAGPFMVDGSFWTFLAYCAVTGGSIMIIGSASGVTVMGMEKIPFSYYFKKFTPLAFLGYVAGAAVYMILF